MALRRIKEKWINYISTSNTPKAWQWQKCIWTARTTRNKMIFITHPNSKNKHGMDAAIDHVSLGIIYLIYHFEEGIQ